MIEMVYADARGRVWERPGWGMAGRLGHRIVEPAEEEMIPLPEGASLLFLPGRRPLGINPAGQFQTVNRVQGEEVFAVAALLPQGYTRTLLPGYSRLPKAPALPLYGYAAVGFKDGEFWVAACPTDEDYYWNPRYYHRSDLGELIAARLKANPENRILQQLARCAQEYSCFTAQNLFYCRWEAGIPVSPACNASCLGCISSQPAECCPAPQERIRFAPTTEEIVEAALPHLRNAVAGIISFGQGCEGEPLLRGSDLIKVVSRLRQETENGTINLNTNASRPDVVSALARAGLDTMRVSLVSARAELYERYHRPQGYTLKEVRRSLRVATEEGVYVSLNLLHFPGVTDRPSEVEALLELVRAEGVSCIQIRNLNLDPEVFLAAAGFSEEEPLGVPQFISLLEQELPGVRIGSYSRPARRGERKR